MIEITTTGVREWMSENRFLYASFSGNNTRLQFFVMFWGNSGTPIYQVEHNGKSVYDGERLKDAVSKFNEIGRTIKGQNDV